MYQNIQNNIYEIFSWKILPRVFFSPKFKSELWPSLLYIFQIKCVCLLKWCFGPVYGHKLQYIKQVYVIGWICWTRYHPFRYTGREWKFILKCSTLEIKYVTNILFLFLVLSIYMERWWYLWSGFSSHILFTLTSVNTGTLCSIFNCQPPWISS